MIGTTNSGRTMAWIAVLLAVLSGCARLESLKNEWTNDRLNKEAAASQVGLPSTPNTLTDQQKANVELAIGRSLEQQGKYSEASKVYQALVAKDRIWTISTAKQKNLGTAYHRLAVLSDRREAWDDSAKYYQKALDKSPNSAEVLCDLGYSYYLQKKWPEAENRLRQALKADPDLARAHNNLAMTLVAVGRNDEALAEFEKTGTDELGSRINFAYALLLNRKLESAYQEFELVLNEDPNSKSARRGMETVVSLASAAREQPNKPVVVTDGSAASLAQGTSVSRR